MKRAIYAGSFDPLTNGHVSIINRGLTLFDEVIVALAINIHKKPLFSIEERTQMIKATFPNQPVRVETFDGLLVEFAQSQQCNTILRGLRGVSDFEYELKMTTMNRHLAPEVETVFLMTEEQYFFVSSSLIKEVARFNGDITRFVPSHVAAALIDRLNVS